MKGLHVSCSKSLPWKLYQTTFSTSSILAKNKPRTKKVEVDWSARERDLPSDSNEVKFARNFMARQSRAPYELAPETEEAVLPRKFGRMRFDDYNAPTYVPQQRKKLLGASSYNRKFPICSVNLLLAQKRSYIF